MAIDIDSAIRAFDWDSAERWLTERFNNLDLSNPHLTTPEMDLLQRIKRNDAFILKRATADLIEKKNNFISNLILYCKHDHVRPVLRFELESLLVFDGLYSIILQNLESNALYQSGMDVMLSNCMTYIVNAYSILSDLCTPKDINNTYFVSTPYIADADSGEYISGDVLSDNLCTVLTSIIKMAAHLYVLTDKTTGNVVLPEGIFAHKSNELNPDITQSFIDLCVIWHLMDEMNERFRHLGGSFGVSFSDTHIAENATSISTTVTYKPKSKNSFSFYDFIANKRLHRRQEENLFSTSVDKELEKLISGYGKATKLPPESFISVDEISTISSLSMSLCLDILKEKVEIQGLTITEIIRGYCTLRELAHSISTSPDSEKMICKIHSFEELKFILSQNGLSETSSEKFISLVTFKISSADLFDAPILKTSNGNYALFTPTMLFGSTTNAIFSILSGEWDKLAHKGKAFEDHMLSFFRENGLNAKTTEFTRDDEKYQYDILIEWDGYVFIIECKNYILSHNYPSRSAEFSEKIDDAINQVLRLKDGAQKYHEVLFEKTDISLKGKIVVPCILNCLPYWEPQREGVIFIDSSFVKRFFSRKTFDVVIYSGSDKKSKKAIYSWWKGDKPSLEDFLEQLKLPLPVKIWQDITDYKCTPVIFNHLLTVLMHKWESDSLSENSIASTVGDTKKKSNTKRRKKKEKKTRK